MPHKRTGLLADVVRTYRAASEGTGANWRAGHALACLAFGAGFGLAGLWLLLSGATFFHSAIFLCAAIACLGVWRFLLKKALWYWHVETTLYGNTPTFRIPTWLFVLGCALLLAVVVGALLRAGGRLAA